MERVPRTKLSKKLDIMQPITIDMLGNEDDPCFGKHFDGKNSACRRCGDSELCLIAQGQKTSKKRDKIEKDQTFLDLNENLENPPLERIQDYWVEEVKSKPKKLKVLLKKTNDKFFNGKSTKETLMSIALKILAQSLLVRKFKGEDGKSYIKLKK